MIHPDYVKDNRDDIPSHEVIYPLMAGARNTILTKLIQTALTQVPDFPEWQDEKWSKTNNWTSFKDSLNVLHNPQSEEELSPLSPARMRLAFDELLANQLALMLVRQKNKNQSGIACPPKNLLNLSLPFKLTKAQKKVIQEIKKEKR